jgi:uncharacterized protein involved in exopolysaccharide biosynthesis
VVLVSFLVPNRYTAATTVLPPSNQADVFGMFQGMPGAQMLSRSLGLDTSSETDIYIGVLKSATVSRALVDRFDLVTVYRRKDAERAGKDLSEHTDVTLTNEGLVRVAVVEKDRELAASLANAYVEELDSFLRQNAISSARRRGEFLERRLEETRPALAMAEDSLRDYQIRAAFPAVGQEVQRTADAMSGLVSEKVRREIELSTLESVSRSPQPRAEELRNEIDQIEREIVKLPTATTALGRLYREVKIQETILLVLAEEYERARILESRNVPVVEVVDLAVPPVDKSSPRRGLVAVATLLVSFVANSLLVLVRQGVLAGGTLSG